MTLTNDLKTKLQNIKSSVECLVNKKIATHNTQSNSSSFGHAKAGGTPENVSVTNVTSAGTDNGLYARADHIHNITKASNNSYGITILSDTIQKDSNIAPSAAALYRVYEMADAALTNSSSGYFTDADREKLNSITYGATKVTVENSLESDSTVNALSAGKGKALKTMLDNKVDKISGKGLSTNDYDNKAKEAVSSIPNYLLQEKVIYNFNDISSTIDYNNITALSAYLGKVLNEGKFNKSGGTITGDVSLTGTESNSKGQITAKKFVVEGGQSNQFLKANGSLDSTSYSPVGHHHNDSYSPLGHTHDFLNLTNRNQWRHIYESPDDAGYSQQLYTNGMFLYLYLETGSQDITKEGSSNASPGWNNCGKLLFDQSYYPAYDLYSAYIKQCVIRLLATGEIWIATESSSTLSNYKGRASFIYPYQLRGNLVP